jgi:hypothetical protein
MRSGACSVAGTSASGCSVTRRLESATVLALSEFLAIAESEDRPSARYLSIAFFSFAEYSAVSFRI